MKKGFTTFADAYDGMFFYSQFTCRGELSMKRPVVVFETTKGNFEVTLFPDVAPKTCENFLGLAAKNILQWTHFPSDYHPIS